MSLELSYQCLHYCLPNRLAFRPGRKVCFAPMSPIAGPSPALSSDTHKAPDPEVTRKQLKCDCGGSNLSQPWLTTRQQLLFESSFPTNTCQHKKKRSTMVNDTMYMYLHMEMAFILLFVVCKSLQSKAASLQLVCTL